VQPVAVKVMPNPHPDRVL